MINSVVVLYGPYRFHWTRLPHNRRCKLQQTNKIFAIVALKVAPFTRGTNIFIHLISVCSTQSVLETIFN